MSDLDKTSQKLIDSIRKTKSGPATDAVQSAGKAKTGKSATASAGKTTKKTAAKPTKAKPTPAKPATKKARPKKSKPAGSSRKAPGNMASSTTVPVPYTDGSPVWPD